MFHIRCDGSKRIDDRLCGFDTGELTVDVLLEFENPSVRSAYVGTEARGSVSIESGRDGGHGSDEIKVVQHDITGSDDGFGDWEWIVESEAGCDGEC